MTKKMQRDSRYLSYILRHNPGELGLEMDEFGYVDVDTLVKNSNFTLEYLKKLVAEETRYDFSEDGKKIKAFHGHSVKGVIYTNEVEAPEELFHGTSIDSYELIKKSGYIKGMSRVLVHLSESADKAKIIGQRHGKPIILVIDTKQMSQDGIKFYKSEDDVFLTEDINIKYIKNTIE